MENQQLITIMTFNSLPAAHIVADQLEAEGIEVFLADELISQIYANVTGGIKLQISDVNFEKSQEILKKAGLL